MTFLQLHRSCTHCHAEWRPMLHWQTSSLTVQNQVHLGRPVWWGHSAGGRLMAARRTHKWYWDGLARAMWSNKRSHLALIVEVTGGWLVLCLTSSLVTWATYGIRRMRHMHHWSNASRRRLETELMHHVSITDHYHCDYLHQSSITIIINIIKSVNFLRQLC